MISPRARRHWFVGFFFPALLTFATPGAAQETPDWATGGELTRRLDAPVGLRWQGAALRPALENFARAQRVALFLDRRVDPGQELQLALQETPLRDALRQIAEDRQLGVSQLGAVHYLGPPATAAALRTLAALVGEEVRELPTSRRAAWRQTTAWRWEELTTPAELLAALAEAGGFEVANPEALPHDLWPAASLPPLSLVDRLTLLTAGFDLTFTLEDEGRRVRLTPQPDPAHLVRSYSLSKHGPGVAARLAPFVPRAKLKVEGEQLHVAARLEDHEIIDAALKGKPLRRTETRPQSPAGGVKVFTLKVENRPLGPVLRALAQQLGLELRLDEQSLQAADISLETRVSFQVENQPLEGLLKALLEPAQLDFRVEDETLRVFPQAR